MTPANRSKSISARFQQASFDDLVDKLSSRVIDTLSPIKVAAYDGSSVYLARAKLAFGNTCKIVRSGNVIRHPDTGEVLGTTEREIATVQITEGLPQMSKGRVTDWIVPDKDIPEGSIARLVSR